MKQFNSNALSKHQQINFLVLDLETRGLPADREKNVIWMCGVYNGRETKIFSNPQGMTAKDLDAETRKALTDKNVVKIIHNSEFDAPLVDMFFGIKIVNIWDTKVAEQIILGLSLPRSEDNEEIRKMFSVSLKYTLMRYKLVKGMDKDIRKNFIDRSFGVAFTNKEIAYLEKDVQYLPNLMLKQMKAIINLDLVEVAKLEMINCEVVSDMRSTGIGFNPKAWNASVKEDELMLISLQSSLEELAKIFCHRHGAPIPSNWNSPAQVKKLLNALDIPITSFKEMDKILRDHRPAGRKQSDGISLLKCYVNVRELSQRISKYGYDWTERFMQADGRVRCNFEQLVNTSRFQLSNPNLSQLPKDSSRRAAFVPARGKRFVRADYDGQEIGIMAAASGEKQWIEAILKGHDIHARSAERTFPEDWAAAKEPGCKFPFTCNCVGHKKLRQKGKTLNFMLAYGGGAQKYAFSTGCTEHEARVTILKYKNSIRHLTFWLEQNGKDGMMTGVSYSASPYQRRRVLYSDISWHLRNQGKNNPVQAAGADMLKHALMLLHAKTKKVGFNIVLPWHDEIILECPISKVPAVKKLLKKCMEEASDFVTQVSGLVRVTPIATTNLLKK